MFFPEIMNTRAASFGHINFPEIMNTRAASFGNINFHGIVFGAEIMKTLAQF